MFIGGIFASLEARAPRRALFHRSGLVDRDLPTAHIGVVEHRDRLVGRVVIRHLNEGETARALGLTVHRNEDRGDLTGRGEELSELLFRRAERDATNKQLRGHAICLK